MQRVQETEDKTAVITNKSARNEGNTTAFFNIHAAGDWISSVKKDLEKRFGKVDLAKTENGDNKEEGDSPLASLSKSFDQLHPMRVMNQQLKNQIKDVAKQNSGKIAGALVEAGIYCAVFHQAKAGLKKVTRDRKYSGPTVRYISDVALPDGLYGPIFGFLIRLALPF